MKNLFKTTFDKVFFCALLVLIALSIVSAVSEDRLLLSSTLPLFIPVFLSFFLLKHNYLSIGLIFFLFFSFLGDVSYFFDDYDILMTNFSETSYLISYVVMTIIALSKFKILEVNRIIGIYLVVVFSINLYLLYIIFEVLRIVIDSNEIIMIGANSLVLMILSFVSFGVYLNTQTKQSISFLVASICFAFSVILNYVNQYYLYDWTFVMISRTLYALGLYQVFKYAIIENKTYVRVKNTISYLQTKC